MISIGEYIQKEYTKTGMKHSFFAQSINMSERNAYNLFNRASIDTNQLYAISKLLKVDFFKIYSQKLAKEVPEIEALNEPEAEYKVRKKKVHKIMIEVELDEDEYKELIKKTNK